MWVSDSFDLPTLICRIVVHIRLPVPLPKSAWIHVLLLRAGTNVALSKATNLPSRGIRRVTQIFWRHIRSQVSKRFRAGGASGAPHNVLGLLRACRRHLHFLPAISARSRCHHSEDPSKHGLLLQFDSVESELESALKRHTYRTLARANCDGQAIPIHTMTSL